MLLPHISQAVELLTDKARQRQAHLDRARRNYVRVLVLGDSPIDPQVLADARRVLESAGYRVSVASSPAAALLAHQSAAERFELFLLAVHLPNLTGPELARRLLLKDPRANFLFLHTPAGPALPQDGLLSPATLVHKPFAPPVLLHAVVAALQRARQQARGSRS